MLSVVLGKFIIIILYSNNYIHIHYQREAEIDSRCRQILFTEKYLAAKLHLCLSIAFTRGDQNSSWLEVARLPSDIVNRSTNDRMVAGSRLTGGMKSRALEMTLRPLSRHGWQAKEPLRHCVWI